MSEEKNLTVKSNNEVETVSREKVIEYVKAFGLNNTLERNEIEQFLCIAYEFNLNPFKREIYCVAYGRGDKRKLSIITGYEVYLKRAERSGFLDGWNVEIFKEDNDMKARITIYRKDQKNPFVHEVYYSEYAQKNWKGEVTKFWKEKPVTMLKKVAMAQGFRLCFPCELGGMPYTADEVSDEMSTQNKDNAIPVKSQPELIEEFPESTALPEFIDETPTPRERLIDAIGFRTDKYKNQDKIKNICDAILINDLSELKDKTDDEREKIITFLENNIDVD